MIEQIREIEKVIGNPEMAVNQEYFVKISNAYYISGYKYNQSQKDGQGSKRLKVKGKLPKRRLNTQEDLDSCAPILLKAFNIDKNIPRSERLLLFEEEKSKNLQV
jgi:hypothetical protein